MANHTSLYLQAQRELEQLRRSTEGKWLDRYIRFINETGRRDEFLMWAAKDIGMDHETIARLFPAPHTDDAGQGGLDP
jgi:hypothetical protein